MDEAKPEVDENGVDLKTGGIGAAVGAVLVGATMFFAGIGGDTVVTEAKITNGIASVSDSLKPAHERYAAREVRDTVKDTTLQVQDTIHEQERPQMTHSNDVGIADYELCSIVKAGQKIQVLMLIDGKVIDAFESVPTKYDWTVSARPRFTLHKE